MSSPTPPPAGPPRWWSRFRATPVVVQLVAWVLLWPLVGALAVAGRGPSRTRAALATVVLVVGAAVWMPVVTGAGEPADVEVVVTAADDEQQRLDGRAAAAAEAERLARAEAREAARQQAEANLAASRERDEEAQARSAAAQAAADARAEADAAREEAARAAAEAEAEAARRAAATWTVFHVVDGDTVDVRAGDGSEERVRIIGIDTPERGECGFGEASSAMARLVDGEQVELVAGARDDRDRYGRVLRYVDVGGVDAGLTLIQQGLAIARYDSRDGYGRHHREDTYVAADRATEHVCSAATPAPAPSSAPPPSSTSTGPGTGPGGAWKNCTEAREHGAAPVHRGDPGYGGHLDRDDDGIGCE
jgi:endonuclease YncB( thermonuclease family)